MVKSYYGEMKITIFDYEDESIGVIFNTNLVYGNHVFTGPGGYDFRTERRYGVCKLFAPTK